MLSSAPAGDDPHTTCTPKCGYLARSYELWLEIRRLDRLTGHGFENLLHESGLFHIGRVREQTAAANRLVQCRGKRQMGASRRQRKRRVGVGPELTLLAIRASRSPPLPKSGGGRRREIKVSRFTNASREEQSTDLCILELRREERLRHLEVLAAIENIIDDDEHGARSGCVWIRESCNSEQLIEREAVSTFVICRSTLGGGQYFTKCLRSNRERRVVTREKSGRRDRDPQGLWSRLWERTSRASRRIRGRSGDAWRCLREEWRPTCSGRAQEFLRSRWV